MGIFGFGRKKQRQSGSSSSIFEDLTGLDERWLEKPLFMELFKCALTLSDTRADVARLGSTDYLREIGFGDLVLHGSGAEAVLRGFNIDENRLEDPGYMNDAIIRMNNIVDRALRMNDDQTSQIATGGRWGACIVLAQYILKLHPDYQAPLQDYLGAVGPTLHPERDDEYDAASAREAIHEAISPAPRPEYGIREKLLNALACTVGLSWYPLGPLTSDDYGAHLEKAKSSLVEALIAGGYFEQDATMEEMIGGTEEVIAGVPLDLILLAPLTFTMVANGACLDSAELHELTDDAYRHHVDVYLSLGGDLGRLERDQERHMDELARLAIQLDAARTQFWTVSKLGAAVTTGPLPDQNRSSL